jgi:hypothetical protein
MPSEEMKALFADKNFMANYLSFDETKRIPAIERMKQASLRAYGSRPVDDSLCLVRPISSSLKLCGNRASVIHSLCKPRLAIQA